MNIDSIKNGIVIDHISAGFGMKLYTLLGLDELQCSIAIIKNAHSNKIEKKDIIKIDSNIEINLDVIGFVNPEATVNIIKNGEIIEKKTIPMPKKLTNVIKCKNPRCITSSEQNLNHQFRLAENKAYRCIYCETKAE